MNTCLLGIDLGTTHLKIGVFDERTGRRLAAAFRLIPIKRTPDGGCETALRNLDRQLRACIAELRNEMGQAWNTVGGVGIAAQGGSSILVRRTSGEPSTPMYLWNDRRCAEFVRELQQRKPPSYWRNLVSYATPPAGLARIQWLQRRFPDCFDGSHIHIGAGEYLFHRLTGVWRQDPGHAIQIGTFNARTQRPSAKALALAGLSLSFVAPLRRGHETAPVGRAGAKLFSLEPGVPVAGPYLDQEAGYLSVTGVGRRPMQFSMGTAWVANFTVDDPAVWPSPSRMALPAPAGEGAFIVQALPAGNTVWDWALTTCLNASHERALKQAEGLFRKRLVPDGGLVCIARFDDTHPSCPAMRGGGALVGLTPGTGADDIVRAVAAGLVCEARRYLAPLLSTGAIDALVLGGGSSRGAYFRTLMAAMFRSVPVHWQRDDNLGGARGALHVFASKASDCPVQPQARPSNAMLDACEAHYNLFTAVSGRLNPPQ